MSEWSDMTLGDLIHVKHGFAFKSKHFADAGDRLVLKPGNFPVGGGIRLRPGKDNYYTGPYPPEFELSPGDLLVVMTDLTQTAPILGSPALVPAEPVMLHNQRLGLVQIKPGAEVDKRFLYYSMLSDSSRSQIRATATGATVRHTAPERIYRVAVKVPPLAVQEVIGDVLGSIDELIANNRRRIEVLEEMARAVYREWFVKFRYPGHADVPMVDSALGPIPEGWVIGNVGALCSRVQAGATPRRSTPEYWDEPSVDWYKTGDLTDGVLLGSSEKISNAGLLAGRTFGAETILMAIYGSPTVGRLGLLSSVASANQAALGLVADPEKCSTEYLWFVLEALRGHLNQISQGAAQQNVSKEKVVNCAVVIPPRELIEKFTVRAAPSWRLSHELAHQSAVLTSVRDLLLPKLVTGEIDVSEIDLGALV